MTTTSSSTSTATSTGAGALAEVSTPESQAAQVGPGDGGTRVRRLRPSSFGLAVLALGMGGFAIGTAEFVTMGLITQIASGLSVSIPTAGHVISTYALGVVVGAPTLAFLGARLPRKGLVLVLMTWFLVGNAASALAGSYGLLALSRFFTGLPHGAYFGVASLIAASMASPERRGRAVAAVMLGLSVANVGGVPAATWLGQTFGWRSAYWTVSALGVLTLVLIALYVPQQPGDPEASGRRELAAFKLPQVWLTLLAGAIGFGGMFALYSYISPAVTEVGGLDESTVPIFLLAFGLGMVVGTWLAGELADWSVFRSLLIGAAGMGISLLVFFLLEPAGWWMLPMAFLTTALSSVLVVNLQLRLMTVSGDAQTIGAALNHASLNVANALGAFLGGIVIEAGLGYRAPALVGVGLSAVGFLVIAASAGLHVRTGRAGTVIAPDGEASPVEPATPARG